MFQFTVITQVSRYGTTHKISESPICFPTVQCRDLWRKECRITHPLGRGAECGALSHKIFVRLENIRVSGSMNRLTGASGRREERRWRETRRIPEAETAARRWLGAGAISTQFLCFISGCSRDSLISWAILILLHFNHYNIDPSLLFLKNGLQTCFLKESAALLLS